MKFNLKSIYDNNFSPQDPYKNSETFVKNGIQNKLIVNLNKENFNSNILTNTKQYINKANYVQLEKYIQNQEIIQFLQDNFLSNSNDKQPICGRWDQIPISCFISLTIDQLQIFIGDDIKFSSIYSQVSKILRELLSDKEQNYICLKKLGEITNNTGICGIYTRLIKELYFIDDTQENEKTVNDQFEIYKYKLQQFANDLVQNSCDIIDQHFNQSQIKIDYLIQKCNKMKDSINFKLKEFKNVSQMNQNLIKSLKQQNNQLKQDIQVLQQSNQNSEFTQDLINMINNLKFDVIHHKLTFDQNQDLLQNIINIFPIINQNYKNIDGIIDMTLNLLIPIYDSKLKWKKNTFNQDDHTLYNNLKMCNPSQKWIHNDNICEKQLIELPQNEYLIIYDKQLNFILENCQKLTKNNSTNLYLKIQLSLIQILISNYHDDLNLSIQDLHKQFYDFKIKNYISQETTNFFLDNFGIQILISCLRIQNLKPQIIYNILEIIDFLSSQKDISIIFIKQLCSIYNIELLVGITKQIQLQSEASLFIVRIFKLMGLQICIRGQLLEKVLSFLERFKENCEINQEGFNIYEINQIQNNFIQ